MPCPEPGCLVAARSSRRRVLAAPSPDLTNLLLRGSAAHLLENDMPLPKAFQKFAEFEREIIHGANRDGLSLEDMVDDDAFDAESEVDSDDPF